MAYMGARRIIRISRSAYSPLLVLVKGDMIAASKLPASDAAASALKTVTAADFPVFPRLLSLKDYMGYWEVVRVFHVHSWPFRHDYMEVYRKFSMV